MQPDILIKWKESKLRTDPSDNSAAHREENEHAVDGKDQTGTTRGPDGVL